MNKRRNPRLPRCCPVQILIAKPVAAVPHEELRLPCSGSMVTAAGAGGRGGGLSLIRKGVVSRISGGGGRGFQGGGVAKW